MPLGDDSFEIARVLRPHGLSGHLQVLTFQRDASALLRAQRVFLEGAPGRIPYRVLEARPLSLQGEGVRVLLRLGALESRERALAWVGALVRLDAEALPPLAADEVFLRDLIGLRCVTVEGQALGVVTEIWPTPSCDQLLIADGDRERFVPALESVVVEVDPDVGQLTVDLSAIGIDLTDVPDGHGGRGPGEDPGA